MSQRRWMTAFSLSVILVVPTISSAEIITFAIGGNSSSASIQGTVDAFRAALGDPLNANDPGPLADGRREINWDGGGSTATAPGVTPFTVFFNTRGALIETPGTGFVQVPVTDNDPLNGVSDIADFYGNPSYDGQFSAFSPVRVFNPVGSNVTDVSFIIPGTVDAINPLGIPAAVGGFGAVFSDVDLDQTTQIQFFDFLGNLIATHVVPAGVVSDGSLSFLGGIATAGEQIGRVRITTGNAALDASTTEGNGTDLAVMDDFLYAEPQQVQVPEPAALALLGLGLAAAARPVRRRSRRR